MILLGMGSNLGNREQNIVTALQRLAEKPEIVVKKVSSLYETEPVGVKEQPGFLNAVADIDTALSPLALLEACLDIEQCMGRVRTIRWGPRIIDIDILLYKNVSIKSKELCIPHPRMLERNFVLIPLREVIGDIPIYRGMTPHELIEKNTDTTEVVFYKRLEIKS